MPTYYVIGQDKTLEEAYTKEQIDQFNAQSMGALPLSGGNMTGNIGYQGSNSSQPVIKFLDNTENTYGNGVSIGAGGITIIGGGESCRNLESVEAPDTEKLLLGADTTIDLYVNVQSGVSNAKKVTLQTNGLFTGHQKAITSGTAAPSGGSNGDIYIQY